LHPAGKPGDFRRRAAVGTQPRITVADAIDAYVRVYAGRDPALAYRLTGFAAALGRDRVLVDVTDDDVFRALEHLAAQPGRYYAGRDADGKPIYKARGNSTADTRQHHYSA